MVTSEPCLTVDSLWMRLLGLPRASMISSAYSSLWGLLIFSSSFQQRPSPFYTQTHHSVSFLSRPRGR